MTEEHPFAQYVRILGKGKRGARSLTEAEAFDAMTMILHGNVEPLQLGAFLMLLRVREESAAEVAGMVRAVRENLAVPQTSPAVQLDWSSYAGKRRHLPWFILAAVLLADEGIPVFMHGTEGHTEGRVYTRDSLTALGLPVAASLDEAAGHLRADNFAYLPLEHLSPILHEIIGLRPLLGLRSPVHTIARMLNPFHAPYQIQGIFHPGYRDIHQEAARLLDQPHMAVLKGEGGEIERNPDQACLVKSVHDGVLAEEEWPAMFSGPRHLKDETMDVGRLGAVWRGEAEDEYGEAAVIGTAAVALKLLGRAGSMAEADNQARSLWERRRRSRLRAA